MSNDWIEVKVDKEEEEKYYAENNYWNPELEDEIEGEVIDYFKDQNNKTRWKIQTDDDEIWVMPSHADFLLKAKNLVLGDRIKVKLVDEEDVGFDYPKKIYQVLVKAL